MRSTRSRFFRLAGLVVVLVLIFVCLSAFLATNPYTACMASSLKSLRPGTTAATLMFEGQERCYLLYVPPDYDGEGALPLIISLPGFISNPKGQEYLTRWNEVADNENLLVAYPQGTSFPLRWNASTTFENSTVDDVQFIADLIGELSRIVKVDPSRIYVDGMSNGGSMANRVACELADKVAAVGIVTGPPGEPPGGCNPARPISLIAFYGTDDPLVSYEPVKSWIEGWADRNGCSLAPEPIPARGDASGVRFTGCQENSEIVFYTIDGGGHTWPGGRPTFVGKTSGDIKASQVMWAFFEMHPLVDTP